jgi:hypothetical protein
MFIVLANLSEQKSSGTELNGACVTCPHLRSLLTAATLMLLMMEAQTHGSPQRHVYTNLFRKLLTGKNTHLQYTYGHWTWFHEWHFRFSQRWVWRRQPSVVWAIALMTEAVGTSETSANFCETAQCSIPEGCLRDYTVQYPRRLVASLCSAVSQKAVCETIQCSIPEGCLQVYAVQYPRRLFARLYSAVSQNALRGYTVQYYRMLFARSVVFNRGCAKTS